MSNVDWSQFRDKDKVRVVFEGEFVQRFPSEQGKVVSHNEDLVLSSYLDLAVSAELIERPFTPPPAGTLLKSTGGWVYLSLGDLGYQPVRNAHGGSETHRKVFSWSKQTDPVWLSRLTILDI